MGVDEEKGGGWGGVEGGGGGPQFVAFVMDDSKGKAKRIALGATFLLIDVCRVMCVVLSPYRLQIYIRAHTNLL